MIDNNKDIVLNLDEIDTTKIPQYIDTLGRTRVKIKKVFLYISAIKEFVCVDIKHLKRKSINYKEINTNKHINILNTEHKNREINRKRKFNQKFKNRKKGENIFIF